MTDLRIANYTLEILESTPNIDANSIKIASFSVEVLHKYTKKVYYTPKYYYFSGNVSELTLPKESQIYAYDSSTYRMVGSCTSDVLTGNFVLPVTTSGTCFIVVLSDNIEYNHLIVKRLVPSPITGDDI